MKYLIAFLLVIAAAFALPNPTGYVNDFANILTDKQSLEQDLALYEQNTTIEIALATLDSVPPDYTLFSYGVELFDQWNIGKKGEDNGILVLIVRNGTVGNRMRIELGYGIQGYITGAEAGEILDAAMPYYTEGNYQRTAEIIIAGLKADLTGYQPGQTTLNAIDETILKIIFSVFTAFIFIIISIVSVVFRNRCPYCLRGKLVKKGNYYVCQRCGKKVSKKKRYAPIIVGGGFGGGGGGGFGGFGGGASGGGGAGR